MIPSIVIGIGNRDRGDDAVGPLVCDLLGGGAPTLALEAMPYELALAWGRDDRVVVVDAAAPAGDPGRITVTDGLARRLVPPTAISTHAIDVSGAIDLARAIGRLPAALEVIGVEGADFRVGAPMTPRVRASVGRVADQLAARLAARP
jgi:hydrogenase maturation protease